MRNVRLSIRVQLTLGWNTYLLFNSYIVNFVWKTDEGEAESIVLLIFVLWWCVSCCWVRGCGGGAESLIWDHLKSPLFPSRILAEAISMTHSGMLYRLDISTFCFYKPSLFQIFVPWKFIQNLAFPCLLSLLSLVSITG